MAKAVSLVILLCVKLETEKVGIALKMIIQLTKIVHDVITYPINQRETDRFS